MTTSERVKQKSETDKRYACKGLYLTITLQRVDFFRKAIVYEFKKRGADTVPKELTTFFNGYFKGYSKVVATERDEGRMNEKEGKDPLSGNQEITLPLVKT